MLKRRGHHIVAVAFPKDDNSVRPEFLAATAFPGITGPAGSSDLRVGRSRGGSPSARNVVATAGKCDFRIVRPADASAVDSQTTPTPLHLGRNQLRKALKYTAGGLIGAGATTLLLGGQAFAADEDPVDRARPADEPVVGGDRRASWSIFMQAGFALVETGFTQKKNAAHVMSTNFAIFGLGFVGFLFIGFPLAFSGFSYSAFGLDTPMNGDGLPAIGGEHGHPLNGRYNHLGDGADTGAARLLLLHGRPSWTPSPRSRPGAMAERWKWKAFAQWGLFCGAIYYPLFAAWTWGGGWLAKSWDTMSLGAGYVDFAGSGVVHAVGGVAALAGAIVLGPRIGKYGTGRQAEHDSGPQHPDGSARLLHPAVRLVRLQRRIDVRRHRRPVRDGRRQHGDRRRRRRSRSRCTT